MCSRTRQTSTENGGRTRAGRGGEGKGTAKRMRRRGEEVEGEICCSVYLTYRFKLRLRYSTRSRRVNHVTSFTFHSHCRVPAENACRLIPMNIVISTSTGTSYSMLLRENPMIRLQIEVASRLPRFFFSLGLHCNTLECQRKIPTGVSS